MKECSGRKVLKVRMSWDDPPHPTSQKKLPGGQQDQIDPMPFLGLDQIDPPV